MLFETLTSFLKRRYVFSFIHINCLGILACEKIMIFMQSIKNFNAKKTNSNIQTCFIFRWAGPRKGEIQGHLWRTRPDLRRDVRLLNHFYQILYKSISQNFFPSQKNTKCFRDLFAIKISNFAALLFCTIFPPPTNFSPPTWKRNEIILFSHGSFWMRWYLPLRDFCEHFDHLNHRSFSIRNERIRWV